MGLVAYVENLREKPEHVRKRAAFLWSFGLTAIVALFWLGSFTDIGIGAKGRTQQMIAEQVITPSETLIAGAGDLVNTIWSKIVKPKKVEFAEVQVLPGKR